MSNAVSIARFARFLGLAALISAVPAFAQTDAYVYVQSSNATAVTLYDTATNGRLTSVGTYPLFATSTLTGGNGSYLFAAGEDSADNSGETNIDTYPVQSNGAIGARSETIDATDYAGSCGAGVSIVSAKLDHTGHYIFVRLYNQENGDCDQWQTYQVASNGLLTFLGTEESPLIGYLETVSSTNNFAYGSSEGSPCASAGEGTAGPKFFPYSRNSAHDLSYDHNFTHTDPAGTGTMYTLWASADPANHLAVLMADCTSSSGLPAKIASYTINPTTGSIASTNTWSDMPATAVNTDLPANSLPPMFTDMSPSGELVAVAGGGFQIFHFNGASPLTQLTGLQRGTDDIGQTAWDDDNHFYTLDFFGGQLRVFTVTPTSFSEDPGSPVNANGGAIVVVSR
jgi:hypothetical protein